MKKHAIFTLLLTMAFCASFNVSAQNKVSASDVRPTLKASSRPDGRNLIPSKLPRSRQSIQFNFEGLKLGQDYGSFHAKLVEMGYERVSDKPEKNGKYTYRGTYVGEVVDLFVFVTPKTEKVCMVSVALKRLTETPGGASVNCSSDQWQIRYKKVIDHITRLYGHAYPTSGIFERVHFEDSHVMLAWPRKDGDIAMAHYFNGISNTLHVVYMDAETMEEWFEGRE